MKKYLAISIVLIIFVLDLAYFGNLERLIFSFSPQAVFDKSFVSEEFDYSAKSAVFNNKEVPIPKTLASEELPINPSVLGESDAKKKIVVDLGDQRLYAFERNKLIYSFLISSGKWGRTPTGIFKIWSKFRYTKMEGGSKALRTYYYLPNVPYVMFFYNSKTPKIKGFSLHGTYWHNNFGTPMSHGCVNMQTSDIAKLYYWAKPDLMGKKSIPATKDNPGTEIIIYGKAPRT